LGAFAKNNTQNGPPNAIQQKKGGDSFFGVQAKLSIGKPNDKYEQEADSVAEKVVAKSNNQQRFFTGGSFFPNTPKPSVQKSPFEEVQKQENSEEVQEKPIAQTITPVLQLATEEEDILQEKCADCETETGTIQKKNESQNTEASNNFESKLGGSKGGGSPMKGSAKSQMEQGFGANFSNVKIHTNSNAVEMNKEIGAQAFTNKNDIYFNEGKYDPGSTSGQKLLAHELTHTIQQSNTGAAEVQTALSKNLIQLNDMLDSFNVPEEDVITKCGELTPGDKIIVLAGGYRTRMASALNISEMVRAVSNLDALLSTQLEWVNDASFTTNFIDYSDIRGLVRAADDAEREVLNINYWKDFFVRVCDNDTMVTALNDLKFNLETKLTWLNAEMMITSWELDYSTIKPWIIHANTTQGERNGLNTDDWIAFFVDVCTETDIVEAVNDLNFGQAIKVTWIIAETVGTGSNLTFPFTAADEAILAEHRSNEKLAEALKLLFTPTEYANAVVEFVLIIRSDLVDPPAAEAEAIRILSVMLGNDEIAKTTMLSAMIAVIIPRNKLLTDLPQFSHLAGVDTFDGRDWEATRGIRSGDNVAFAEENLLGGTSTATFEGNLVGTGHSQGFSSATHEFAHGLHVNIMSDADKAIITAAFDARKVSAVAAPTDSNQWVDGREGCYASSNEREFFAQLSNAYLGANAGTDATTRDARHNGAAWVLANEPTVHAILTRLYGGNTIPNTNP